MQRLESLESRALFSVNFVNGVVTIDSPAGGDSLYVTIGAGSKLHVIDNGQSIGSWPVTSVTKIVFNGSESNDAFTINGQLGAIPALLIGNGGDDQLNGAGGNDTILGGAGRDGITGNDGDDLIDAGDGDDNLSGGKGNDTILGGAGRDLMVGGEGDDKLDGGADADTFRGGAGIDTADYSSRTNSVFVDITGTPDEIADDGEAGEKDFVEYDMENVIGGAGDDLLIGTQVSTDKVTTVGYTPNNVLIGNGGNDTLLGDDGDDVLDGGLGADILTGGEGSDIADYSTRSENLMLDLDGIADDGAVGENDRINADIENLRGGSGADRLVGNGVSNALFGNGGNDTLDGGLGKDLLNGGDGIDTADYSSRTESLTLNLDGEANDGAKGEKDRIGTDIDNILGGVGNDTITGNNRANLLRGNAGNDVIRGGAGNDSIYGDAGADRLFGDAGNDTFYSRSDAADADQLDGGAGRDRARIDGLDKKTLIESLIA